ncbi:MAG: hypothetical protein ACREL4_04685 [Gemmatimonadales bacterium]
MTAPRVALLCLLLAACGHKPAATSSAAAAGTASATASDDLSAEAHADATRLGHELFELVDKTMSYYSSHYGQFPGNINALGIDSLTPTTVSRLAVNGKVPTITVAFRHAEGHAVTSCSGTNQVLEDSMLNGGTFSIECTLSGGSARTITVGG